MKQTIITALLALVALTVQAREKEMVWENPTIEFGTDNGDGFFTVALDITKVELKETETVVYMTVMQRSDYPDNWFQFVSDTYLQAGLLRYALVKAEGIELNVHQQTGKDFTRDIVFHFHPLPLSTKSFDFIEGDGNGAFQIKGIKPVEERWKQLFPSYWRDEQTGDWQLALFEDCAIYQCKFWDYKTSKVNAKTGEAEMVLSNGNDELTLKVGKDKKGKRAMQIGQQKVVWSMITSRFMPDYPTQDLRTDYTDTGYKTDTITVVGWIKDMPEHYKKEKIFKFSYQNLFTDHQESADAELDEQGRFSVKIPALNSTEFFCDWSRCFLRMMLEPGKTYFMLYDYKEGRRYFMGDDCRLQNELFKYPLDWERILLQEGEDIDQYIASSDSLLKARYAYLDALQKAHPTLSTRFMQYRKGNTLGQQADAFGRSRFSTSNYQFTPNARQYAYDTFWTKIEKPYTLHREAASFIRYYLEDAARAHDGSITVSIIDHIDEIASNDEELALLNQWKNWAKEATAAVDAASTPEEKQRVADELNAKNADMIQEVEKIINAPRVAKVMDSQILLTQVRNSCHMLDSLNADPFLKDVYISQLVYQMLDHRRASLLPEVLDTVRAVISNPIAIERIEKLNEHYLAVENREFDKLVVKSSDDLQGISEGEALLKKIIEPFKGKFVLLDVWGTWCGPCKAALAESQEEYDQLKDYDIEFLYLANNSPQDSWENVIKEYNVSGDNVAHYNLPKEQQSAIESYLGVHAYPTYKLFDRDGNLLNLNVDARDLDDLKSLLDKLK